MGFAVGPLLHAQTIWTAGSGNWATGSNWNAGVPDSGTDASITNSGTATLTGTGAVSTLNIGDGAATSGTLTVTGGNLTAGVTLIGINGGTGFGTISSGNWTTTGSLNIGEGADSNGSLTVSGGTFSASTNGNYYLGSSGGTGNATVSGGTLSYTGNFRIGEGADSLGSLTVNGGALAVSGQSVVGADNGTATANMTSGTWTSASLFIGNSGGTGTLTISGGTISTTGESRIGASTGGVGNATVSDGNWTVSNTLFVGRSGATGTLTVSGGTVTATTLQLATDSGSSGTVTLNSGIIATQRIAEGNGTGGTVNLNGGTVRATVNQSNFFQNFETGDIQLGSTGPIFDTQAFAVGITNILQGVGGLTKSGSGVLTLTGAQAYTGTTTVSAGTLLVNGSIASGGSVVVSGGTLGGTGTINSATTIQSGGTLAPGASPGVLTFSNGLTLNSGSATNFEINDDTRGTTYDGINLSAGLMTYGGTLNLSFGQTFVNGTTLDLFQLSGSGSSGSFSSIAATGSYTGALTNSGGTWSYYDGSQYVIFTQSTGDLTFSAIPEPSTYAALVGLGALGFVMWRRRRSAAVAATS